MSRRSASMRSAGGASGPAGEGAGVGDGAVWGAGGWGAAVVGISATSGRQAMASATRRAWLRIGAVDGSTVVRNGCGRRAPAIGACNVTSWHGLLGVSTNSEACDAELVR